MRESICRPKTFDDADRAYLKESIVSKGYLGRIERTDRMHELLEAEDYEGPSNLKQQYLWHGVSSKALGGLGGE